MPDIFGKLNAPVGIDHTAFQEVFEEVARATIEDVGIVSIGKGYFAEGEEALLTINSVAIPPHVTFVIEAALEEFFGIVFQMNTSGDIVIVKPEFFEGTKSVIAARIGFRQAAIESEARRQRDLLEKAQNPEPYEEPDERETDIDRDTWPAQ